MYLFPDPKTLKFRTSSYSDLNNCVEVAGFRGGAAVRDSKTLEKGHLTFTASEWTAFVAAVKRDAL